MDYDAFNIAATYDKGRAVTPEALRQWRELLTEHIEADSVSLVVDLGCGTGRFSELLAAQFAAKVVAIEPSQKMLDQARRKLVSGAADMLQRAAAEALPLKDSYADFIFMSNIYHHLAEPALVAGECHRVLRHGGHVVIRNGTRESDFPQRHFFPAIQPLIDSQLPTRTDILANFTAAGFTAAVHEIVTQAIASDWRSFVEKSATRVDSFHARIADRDFERGMTALRAQHATIDPAEPVTEEIDWFVFAKRA
ncbi:MAG: class I SAM-dependent methyltransferase [Alphaproteobacteria bacterium]|nr:class I SAM-dependent methyltransferase [Alphaproteobacteria bacterium]